MTELPDKLPPEEAIMDDDAPGVYEDGAPLTRPRTSTTTAEIDRAIDHPGAVKINVKGAFIVDPEPCTPRGNDQENSSISSASGSGRISPEHDQSKDIRLPHHHGVVSHIAVDIGGSLAKLVYFSRESSKDPGGRLNFMSFETDRIDDCIEFMKDLKNRQQQLNGSVPAKLSVVATGGGAFKYYDKIKAALGVNVLQEDEMECLMMGLDFFITEIPREVFTYSETEPMHFATPSDKIYPYLLANIGSGVSFLKVSGPSEYQRVGGTSLGGGTLWGLLSLLTGARTFDEMLDNASHGDNSRVDMLVGDIYGANYDKVGLKSTTIASSFGKVFRMKRQAESEAEDHGGLHTGDNSYHAGGHYSSKDEEFPLEDIERSTADLNLDGPSPTISKGAANIKGSTTERDGRFTNADISRSLLYAISNNIGQIAHLQSQMHGLSNIYFGGSFIRGHPQTMNTLSYAIRFWSQGRTQAYFLRHEGYLGAVGAFLKRQPTNWGRRGSFEGLAELHKRMGDRLGQDGCADRGWERR